MIIFINVLYCVVSEKLPAFSALVPRVEIIANWGQSTNSALKYLILYVEVFQSQYLNEAGHSEHTIFFL